MDFVTISHIVIGAIKSTPLWVWLLFAFLLYRSVLALSMRTVRLTNLFILPIVFFVLAINGLIQSPHTTFCTTCVWGMALLAGVVVAWFMNRSLRIRVDKAHHLLELPGTISVLIMILCIFAAKYYFGYMSAVNPELASTAPFVYAKLTVYGLISGLTIGKMLRYLDKYRRSESVNLSGNR